MAENDNRSPNPPVPPESNPEQPPLLAEPIPDSDDSSLDFGTILPLHEGASGVIPLAELPDPTSSPSLVSWAEVIRQHRESTQPAPDAPPDQPVTIDATSDKDLLRIVAEEQARNQGTIAFDLEEERDTDKLGQVPLVTEGAKTGSSVQLDDVLNPAASQTPSGSVVRFEVTDPPSDAGGAMPSPWAETDIPEAFPADDEADWMEDQVPLAEPLSLEHDPDQILFAEPTDADGSAIMLVDDGISEDIIELPPEALTAEHSSSLLDILVDEEKAQGSSEIRAAAIIEEFSAGPLEGVLSGVARSESPQDGSSESEILFPLDDADPYAEDAVVAAGAEWLGEESPSKENLPAFAEPVESGDEAVDLYAEGPVSHGISDSGRLNLDEEGMEDAARRQQIVESSAIDLSSHPGVGSILDLNVDGSSNSGEIVEPLAPEEVVSMDLPEGEELAGSMIRQMESLSIESAALSSRNRTLSPSEEFDLEAAELNAAAAAELEVDPVPPPSPRQAYDNEEEVAFPEPVWEAEENEAPVEVAPEPRRTPRRETARQPEAEPPRKKGSGLFLGGFLGLLLGAGALAGVWYAKLLPANPDTLFGGEGEAKKKPDQPTPPTPTPPVAVAAATPESARQLLESGNPARAVEAFDKCDAENPEVLAGKGQAKWLSYLQSCSAHGRQPQRTDAEVVAAKTDLAAAIAKAAANKTPKTELEAARAGLWLGLIEESFGNFDAAEQIYLEVAQATSADGKALLSTASNRLKALRAVQGRPVGMMAPHHLLLAFTLLLADEPVAPLVERESGFLFWEALLLAVQHEYAKAASLLPEVKAIHERQKIKMAGKGLNPLSDPREQMLPAVLDELKRYWEICDQLYRRPEAKALVEQKKVPEALAAAFARSKEADDALKLLVEKLQAKPDLKPAEVAERVLKNEAAKKAAEDQLAALAKSLRDAGVDEPKVADGLKKLVGSKADADAKLKAVADELGKAGFKEAEAAKALATLIAAREASESIVKGVRERLAKEKYVEPNAAKEAIFKAVDNALTRGSTDAVKKLADQLASTEAMATKLNAELQKVKKDSESTIAKAKNEADSAIAKAKDDLAVQKSAYESKLANVRTPAQVVEVWLLALQDKDKPANAAEALSLADLVLKNAASTATEKAKALAVKALALRNQGRLTEAREAFKEALAHAGFAKDQAWSKEVAKAAETLENPAAFVGVSPSPAAPPAAQKLLDQVESGLKLFPAEKFPKDHACLLATRSLLKLEANDLAGAAADAEASVTGGAGPDGQFAFGRVLERQGKLADAEKAYRAVLADAKPGSVLSRQAQLGLTRVLLQKSAKPAGTSLDTVPPRPVSRLDRAPWPLEALLVMVLFTMQDQLPQDLEEALKLADQLIAGKEYLGYILKADALAKLGRYNDALQEFSTGIKALKVLPKEYDGILERILALHPDLQKPSAALAQDPSLALKHYGDGLELFRVQKYDQAEKQFIQSIRYSSKDARPMYYLGLSRWLQGKEAIAVMDFRAAAVLENQGKPTYRAVNESLERVQGESRRVVEKYRP